jgi:hypothetical protein
MLENICKTRACFRTWINTHANSNMLHEMSDHTQSTYDSYMPICLSYGTNIVPHFSATDTTRHLKYGLRKLTIPEISCPCKVRRIRTSYSSPHAKTTCVYDPYSVRYAEVLNHPCIGLHYAEVLGHPGIGTTRGSCVTPS